MGQVTRRFSQKRADDADWEANAETEAKRMTTRMKHARWAQDMINILDSAVDEPIFNFFHASAAYHKLATLKRRRGLRQEDWESAVLLRLHETKIWYCKISWSRGNRQPYCGA